MGVKDKNFMKKMYIDPILGTRLRMTEPDSPTSPTQKYEAWRNYLTQEASEEEEEWETL